MGNCQAIDSVTLVIQHPSGRVDKLYWPITAAEVMKSNPGHYVALLVTTTTFRPPTTATAATTASDAAKLEADQKSIGTVRVTRIKLLRPADTLILGQVYRLVTNQEVMKGISAKKYAKMKKNQELCDSLSGPIQTKSSTNSNKQVQKEEKHRKRAMKPTGSGVAAKSRPWQPSLNSISESTS